MLTINKYMKQFLSLVFSSACRMQQSYKVLISLHGRIIDSIFSRDVIYPTKGSKYETLSPSNSPWFAKLELVNPTKDITLGISRWKNVLPLEQVKTFKNGAGKH